MDESDKTEGWHVQARSMAEVIEKFFNEKRPPEDRVGWILMVYPQDKPGSRVSYLSNGRQDDIPAKLRDEIRRWDADSVSAGYI